MAEPAIRVATMRELAEATSISAAFVYGLHESATMMGVRLRLDTLALSALLERMSKFTSRSTKFDQGRQLQADELGRVLGRRIIGDLGNSTDPMDFGRASASNEVHLTRLQVTQRASGWLEGLCPGPTV